MKNIIVGILLITLSITVAVLYKENKQLKSFDNLYKGWIELSSRHSRICYDRYYDLYAKYDSLYQAEVDSTYSIRFGMPKVQADSMLRAEDSIRKVIDKEYAEYRTKIILNH